MSSEARIFTPHVAESALKDGTVVYAASTDEMPGVVCEGSTAKEALSELIQRLASLAQRYGWENVAFNTPAVRSWSWQAFINGKAVAIAKHSGSAPSAPLAAATP